MCKKCGELDREIERYRSSQLAATDSLAIELLGIVVEELQSEKDALHPDEERPL